MFGLIFIYYLGRSFYELATMHNKPQWQTAILGVVAFYCCIFLGGIILGILAMQFGFDLESQSDTIIGVLCVPFGLLGAWLLHKYLNRRWSTDSLNQDNGQDLLDQNI